MLKKLITILLFSVIVAYGQKQEYKAKGVKWEYDKLEGIETYYTDPYIVSPYTTSVLSGRLRIITETNGYKLMRFFVLFKTPSMDNLTSADRIKFYNKDMDSIEFDKIHDIDLQFLTGQYNSGYSMTLWFDLDYTQINLFKDLLKYKKINARVYSGNRYTEYFEKVTATAYPISGVEALLNLMDVYNKIFDANIKLLSDLEAQTKTK